MKQYASRSLDHGRGGPACPPETVYLGARTRISISRVMMLSVRTVLFFLVVGPLRTDRWMTSQSAAKE